MHSIVLWSKFVDKGKMLRLSFHPQCHFMQFPVFSYSVTHGESCHTIVLANNRRLNKRHQRWTSGGYVGLWLWREQWGSSIQVPEGKTKTFKFTSQPPSSKASIKERINKFSSFLSCFIKDSSLKVCKLKYPWKGA